METTIKVSDDVKSRLDKLKMFHRETYNEIIDFLLEDYLELNSKTKSEILEANKRIDKGEFYTQEDVEELLN